MTPQNVPEGSVVITPSQVYDEVRNCTTAVNKLLQREERNEEQRRDSAKRLDAVEVRVSVIEKRMWIAAGIFAGGGSTLGNLVGQYLTK